MKRGEIWLADLDPSVGAEANKTRPVVLVTNDGANRRAQTVGRGAIVTVVPITSNVSVVLPFHVLATPQETGLDHDSKIQPEQIRAIDASRLVRRIGLLDPRPVWQLDEAIRLHLAL